MNLNGFKILAIDDTFAIRTFLRVSLQDEGAEFYGASTANEGLTICKEIMPDLVVLDLGLPDIDGLDFLPEIKKLQNKKEIPVLILTVRKGKETINKAFSNGADAYLTKPFMVEELLEIINQKLCK